MTDAPDPLEPDLAALLDAEREARPSDDALGRIWSKVERSVGAIGPAASPRPSTGSGGRPSPGPDGTAGWGGSHTGLLVGIAFAVGGATGAAATSLLGRPTERVVYIERPAAVAASPDHVAATARSPVPVAAPDRSAPAQGTPDLAAPPPRAAPATHAVSVSAAASSLPAERAILDEARTALAQDDGARAIALADEHARRFPHPQLREEREAIAIEAMVIEGRYDEARDRAKQFRAASPDSLLSSCGRREPRVDSVTRIRDEEPAPDQTSASGGHLMKKCIALFAALVACHGPEVELGGSHEDASPVEPADDSGSSPGPTTPATCGYPVVSAACVYSGACSNGSGFLWNAPAFCSDEAGPQESFTSAAQVAAALVGTWSGCALPSSSSEIPFVESISPQTPRPSSSPATAISPSSRTPRDRRSLSLVAGSAAGDSGTFEVVDASASLGAGNYQVKLSGSDGGVHAVQVVAFSSGPRLRFFAPGASDYMHAPSKQFQANVCGPAFGPVDTPSSGDEALARLKGTWVRCSNPAASSLFSAFADEGIVFPGDGTWYALVENGSGALVRTPDPLSQGTVEVVTSSPPSLRFYSVANEGAQVLQPILGQCGTLVWTTPQTDALFEGGLPDNVASTSTCASRDAPRRPRPSACARAKRRSCASREPWMRGRGTLSAAPAPDRPCRPPRCLHP